MTTFDEIKQQVASSGGVMTFDAWELREAQGAGRLTERINSLILKSLGDHGMGAVPNEAALLPTHQYGSVRVYDKASAIGRVIEAALSPGEKQDRYLVETIDTTAADILEQIRTLVAE
ncbi:hypothetical protein GCM10009633_23970 [Janibacter melonis]|uniref:hypothetical protein n=1 Tax=Janibacter melonis TaxID=262209 RepID=UPI001E4D663A|nr:hypothetical protein [Janibacter melonis]MCB5993225.1 hypothetical protein [Janibacter melonis]